jgi:thiamine pyrophosphate-dependent acetolactate synthase large subunit-like protein
MKVHVAAAHAFVKEGTTTIFGLLGEGNVTWWYAISKFPQIRFINVRDEGAGLTMAEGWARYSGKVGVCSVTRGPGLARLTTSLIAAVRSQTPIVIYTGKTVFNNENRDQFLEQDKLVTATGAGYIEVLNPNYVETAVRTAFYRARLERRPIVLCVPHDVMNKEIEGEGDDYQTSTELFAGQQRIRPDVDVLNRAAKLITSAKKPVVLVGRGAMNDEAKGLASKLAKRIGALLATSLIAKGTLQEEEFHAGVAGLFSSRESMGLFEEADLVIALGAHLNTQTLEGGYLVPNAKIIQIDVLPHVVMGTEKSADCYVQGDAVATAKELLGILEQQNYTNTGFRTPETKKVLAHQYVDTTEYEIEPGTLDPREAMRIIDDMIPQDVSMVMGSGQAFTFPATLMTKQRPLYMFVTAFGCIGQVMGIAIGAAVAAGDKRMVYFSGDGSTMQNVQELDTAARAGVNLLFVIMNDEGFASEYLRLIAEGHEIDIALTPSPDFATVAKGFGCRGRIARTLDDVKSAVQEFLSGKGPMVIDLRVSRKVISIPYRRLVFGEDA